MMNSHLLNQDPLRPEAREAVQLCTKAGVVVRMLTGDNVITARAIAVNCGILQPNDSSLVMEGRSAHECMHLACMICVV